MFQKKNFAKSTLSAQLLTAGTSLSVQTGDGVKFPDTGSSNVFMGVIWGSAFSTPERDPNREIVEAYRSVDDSFTIVRAKEGTSAKGWEENDNFMLTVTAGVYDEYEIGNADATTTMDDTDEMGLWDTTLDTLYKITFLNFKIAIGKYLMPVGTIREFNVSTNPGTLLGFGTWVAYGTGRVTVAIDGSDTDFDTVDETGGAKTHTLTEAELAAHNHRDNRGVSWGVATTTDAAAYYALTGDIGTTAAALTTTTTGSGNAHNNVQPYITLHRWVRTE